jgi:hypothetical protein
VLTAKLFSMAMSTTISDALSEYSHPRAGLIPRATLASYQRGGRPALRVRWSIAASSRNAATNQSIRRLPGLALS